MTIQTLLTYFSRILFFGASAAVVLAFGELLVGVAGVSLIANAYPAGRLIELAAALMVVVIAITLREIRDEMRANQPRR